MSTPAQLSVIQAQIDHELEQSKIYSDYAVTLRENALRRLPELFPTGSVVVGSNGTRSVIVGHKDDQLAFCNLNSNNAGWSHWRNLKPICFSQHE